MPPSEPLRIPEAAGPVSSQRCLRILVVEDDSGTLTEILSTLEVLGHWATGVQTAESALSRFCEGMFDVLFVDVDLPALSGIDLADKIRIREDLPVIFATGREPPFATTPHAIWLEKPFRVDSLSAALEWAARQCAAGRPAL